MENYIRFDVMTEDKNRHALMKYASDVFPDGYTLTFGHGQYLGTAEDSAIITVLAPSAQSGAFRARAADLARRINARNDQHSTLVVETDCRATFVRSRE